MASDNSGLPTHTISSAQTDAPVFRDAAEETADRAVLAGAPIDHCLGDFVAAATETPEEAAIDARSGLRGHGGRKPTEEDFAGLLTPEGNTGITGSDVVDDAFVFGEDGSTRGTNP